MKLRSSTVFAALSSALALAAVVAGWLVIGSPGEVRLIRFDAIRASDLALISSAINNYRLSHESLPQNLEELRKSAPGARLNFLDPKEQPYGYGVKDSFSYDLCATFDRSTEISAELSSPHSVFEKHGMGKQCFSLEARPRSQR